MMLSLYDHAFPFLKSRRFEAQVRKPERKRKKKVQIVQRGPRHQNKRFTSLNLTKQFDMVTEMVSEEIVDTK